MDIDVTPLQQEALGDRVARALRRKIVSGELERGTHLVEGPLSESFGVSRGPIRDALRALESDGLVESRRRGAFVVGLDENDIDELYSLREVLEAFALDLVLEQERLDRTPFVDAVEAMRDAAQRGDSASFAEADVMFHRLFYTASHHRRLHAMWHTLEPTFVALLEISTAQDDDLGPSAESHAQILDAVLAGDGDSARTELGAHLLGARSRITAAHQRRTGRPAT
ncbi:transcriptional regulator, GntR family [Beutenbergia cavernae DSM 12333]|uniref:Transcriptional regulator, GntR family n=1 Tax=Beutenbergia cavernae (strain ATCC BAA-8 / DSM 12333 / CCUG 43141 / JCM 11478 / NBRC 16432 / NCIMB 13614 / HKI 0122) TaxID=471853 RepID=C5C374_BEUC1|nr:GntR family transcriptional regulator [Beutenbergia cavernae]ACQ79773.1 transcriptional regulator, GntR family [Beutenbergia cavernae DSM 12333]